MGIASEQAGLNGLNSQIANITGISADDANRNIAAAKFRQLGGAAPALANVMQDVPEGVEFSPGGAGGSTGVRRR
jgi:hypothetical protein